VCGCLWMVCVCGVVLRDVGNPGRGIRFYHFKLLLKPLRVAIQSSVLL